MFYMIVREFDDVARVFLPNWAEEAIEKFVGVLGAEFRLALVFRVLVKYPLFRCQNRYGLKRIV